MLNETIDSKQLKLLCVLAHPDDETLGMGGMLARYAAEGISTHLVTATRGQRGWFGNPDDYPGPEELGVIREKELRAAAEVLGIEQVRILGYVDGELDQAPPQKIIYQIAASIRAVRPEVLVTFDPKGVYGHPDHIAISQFAAAAALAAASPGGNGGAPPHQVQKLYYLVPTRALLDAYQAAFGELVMHVDGVDRKASGWVDWSITTRVDASDYWQQVWEAVACHRSQLPGYQRLLDLPEHHRRGLWQEYTFYRAYSLVNGGHQIESDLFQGVRAVERAH
jgi:LmbE family N-acetylglucosaminyl deacetylase